MRSREPQRRTITIVDRRELRRVKLLTIDRPALCDTELCLSRNLSDERNAKILLMMLHGCHVRENELHGAVVL